MATHLAALIFAHPIHTTILALETAVLVPWGGRLRENLEPAKELIQPRQPAAVAWWASAPIYTEILRWNHPPQSLPRTAAIDSWDGPLSSASAFSGPPKLRKPTAR